MPLRLKSMIGSAVLTAGLSLFAQAGDARAAEAGHPCTGPSPIPGVEIRGPVLHVVDGRTLCVALGFETDAWILLRLDDAPADPPLRRTSTAAAPANPRGALMEAALAKMATCRTMRGDDGAVVAACEVDGKPLGRSLRDPKVIAASYAWR